MAKIVGDGQGDVRRSFKGAAYVRGHRGQTLLVAMPTRQKKQKSEKQLAAMDLMRQRSLAVKAMAPELVYWSARFAKGTALMPRDWLFMAMAGRYVLAWMPEEYITGPYAQDGIEGVNNGQMPITPDTEMPFFDKLRNLYPMAALNDLSFLFDIYGDTPGTIFYRTKDGWRGLPPGDPLDILTLQPDGALAWQPAVSGGGGLLIPGGSNPSISRSLYSTKGSQYAFPSQIEVLGLNVYFDQESGVDYQGSLFEWDGAALGAELARTAIVNTAPADGKSLYLPFATPPQIAANQQFVALFTRITGDPDASLPIYTIPYPRSGWVFPDIARALQFLSSDPLEGQVPVVGSNVAYYVLPVARTLS